MIDHGHEVRAQFSLTTLQFIVGILVIVGGACVAWGSLTSQLNGNREGLMLIRQDFADFRREQTTIRDHQIHNEALIDELRRDVDEIQRRGGSSARRLAIQGPK